MPIQKVSFQNNLIAKQTQQQQNVTVSPVAAKSIEDTVEIATKKKENKALKYTLIGIGALLSVAMIIKRKNIAAFFKKSSGSIEKPTIMPKEPLPIKPPITETPITETPPEIITEPSLIKPKYVIDELRGIVTKTVEDEQAQKEVYASKIYELIGVKTSETKFIGGDMNYIKPTGIESKFIDGLKDLSDEELSSHPDICKAFGPDIFLANKNILKSCKLDKNNNLIRVDLSNTLGLDSDGSQHHFGVVVDELSDFLNPEKHPQNSKIYSALTRENLISSLEKICSVTSKDISYKHSLTLNESSNILNRTKYYDTLVARKKFLKTALEIAKTTEQDTLSIFEYLEKIKNKATINIIEEAKHYNTLKNIEHSIDNIEDKQNKEMLSSLLEKRIKYLTTENKKPNEISEFEVGEIFEKFTHKAHKLSDEEITKIKEQYGIFAPNYIQKPLSTKDIKNITTIINKNNGKYLEFWKKNPEKMLMYVKANEKIGEQLAAYDDAAWDTVIGAYKSFCENPDLKLMEALSDYGGFGKYDNINASLRFNGEIDEILKSLERKVNIETINLNLSRMNHFTDKMYVRNGLHGGGEETKDLISKKLNSLIEKVKEGNETDINFIKNELQDLKKQMNSLASEAKFTNTINTITQRPIISNDIEANLKLGRNETSDCFSSLLMDGENLAKLMVDARENPELQDKIIKYFGNQNPSLIQPGFLSTSISPYSSLSGNIKWDLKLGKNVKYSYVSDLACISGRDSGNGEAEILIHPGHKIKILNAKFENLKWKLTGIILPTES